MCTNRLAPFTIRRLVLRSTDDVFCGIVLRTIAFASSASLSRRRRRRRRDATSREAESGSRVSQKKRTGIDAHDALHPRSLRPSILRRATLPRLAWFRARVSSGDARVFPPRARWSRGCSRRRSRSRARSRRTRTGASTSARPRSASTSRAAARSVRAASGARPRVSPGTRRRNAG